MSAKRTVYLHIGLHKTGSTSLQVALTTGRTKLLGYGILYPSAACPISAPYGHHILPWSVIQTPHYLPVGTEIDHAIWDSLRKEIDASAADRVVLSSEEFDVLNEVEIKLVGEHLAHYEIVPVVFLRNHRDLIESCYRTTVIHSPHRGDARSFAVGQRTRLDFHQMLHDWFSISSGRIVVIDHDRRWSDDAVTSFFHAIRLSAASASAPTKVRDQRWNPSFPAFVCEAVRTMRIGGLEESAIGEWLATIGSAFVPEALHSYRCMPDDVALSLDSRYMEEARAINLDPILSKFISLSPTPPADRAKPINSAADAFLAIGQTLRFA